MQVGGRPRHQAVEQPVGLLGDHLADPLDMRAREREEQQAAQPTVRGRVLEQDNVVHQPPRGRVPRGVGGQRAVEVEQTRLGHASLAVPVSDGGAVVAALAVTAPTARGPLRRHVPPLRAAALGASPGLAAARAAAVTG